MGLVDELVSREQLLDAARRLIGEGKRSSCKDSTERKDAGPVRPEIRASAGAR